MKLVHGSAFNNAWSVMKGVICVTIVVPDCHEVATVTIVVKLVRKLVHLVIRVCREGAVHDLEWCFRSSTEGSHARRGSSAGPRGGDNLGMMTGFNRIEQLK